MNIRDSWSSEYSRKSFSVQVDENDYAKWLEEAGVDPARNDEINLRLKFRIMRLLAASWTLGDEADHYDRVGEDEVANRLREQLKLTMEELGKWADAVKGKFGEPAS